jgi:hypothetical protein
MKMISVDSCSCIGPLPPAAARDLGSQTLAAVSHSDRHLLLTTIVPGEEVSMAGLLGDLGVADLLSFFNMFRKTGILRFTLEGGGKDLYFQQGEVVFATSSFSEEDLGEIVYGLGKVDRNTLQKARQFVNARNPLGKVLVEKGFVNSKDLWQAIRGQVETIVYHLFTFHQGGYAFIVKALEDEEIVRLSMSTQNLIMEGLRRVDERALFMRRIGSLDAVPVPARQEAEGLTGTQKRLMQLVEAEVGDVREVLRRSGVGEFDALRLLYQLVEKGAVRIEEAPPLVVDGELGEILTIYNGALTALYRAVAAKNPDFDQEIRLFLRDLPQPFSYVFRDASIEEDGSIVGGKILANLAGLEEGDKKKLLADALSELIYMECIVARQELGTAASAELIRRVQKISSRVKDLVGR